MYVDKKINFLNIHENFKFLEIYRSHSKTDDFELFAHKRGLNKIDEKFSRMVISPLVSKRGFYKV
jgi:hypothetical protein